MCGRGRGPTTLPLGLAMEARESGSPNHRPSSAEAGPRWVRAAGRQVASHQPIPVQARRPGGSGAQPAQPFCDGNGS